MKKHFYIFICLIAAGAIANAQIKKDATLLGGNISFSTQSQTNGQLPDTRHTTLEIGPSFGKAIKENLIMGVDLGYFYIKNKEEQPNSDNYTINGYGAGFFLRQYKYLGSHFYIFGQGRLGVSNSIQKNGGSASGSDFINETKAVAVNLSLSPGLSYAINGRWQLETTLPNLAALSYSNSKTTYADPANAHSDSRTNSFSLSSSLSNAYQLNIGVRMLINR